MVANSMHVAVLSPADQLQHLAAPADLSTVPATSSAPRQVHTMWLLPFWAGGLPVAQGIPSLWQALHRDRDPICCHPHAGHQGIVRAL